MADSSDVIDPQCENSIALDIFNEDTNLMDINQDQTSLEKSEVAGLPFLDDTRLLDAEENDSAEAEESSLVEAEHTYDSNVLENSRQSVAKKRPRSIDRTVLCKNKVVQLKKTAAHLNNAAVPPTNKVIVVFRNTAIHSQNAAVHATNTIVNVKDTAVNSKNMEVHSNNTGLNSKNTTMHSKNKQNKVASATYGLLPHNTKPMEIENKKDTIVYINIEQQSDNNVNLIKNKTEMNGATGVNIENCCEIGENDGIRENDEFDNTEHVSDWTDIYPHSSLCLLCEHRIYTHYTTLGSSRGQNETILKNIEIIFGAEKASEFQSSIQHNTYYGQTCRICATCTNMLKKCRAFIDTANKGLEHLQRFSRWCSRSGRTPSLEARSRKSVPNSYADPEVPSMALFFSSNPNNHRKALLLDRGETVAVNIEAMGISDGTQCLETERDTGCFVGSALSNRLPVNKGGKKLFKRKQPHNTYSETDSSSIDIAHAPYSGPEEDDLSQSHISENIITLEGADMDRTNCTESPCKKKKTCTLNDVTVERLVTHDHDYIPPCTCTDCTRNMKQEREELLTQRKRLKRRESYVRERIEQGYPIPGRNIIVHKPEKIFRGKDAVRTCAHCEERFITLAETLWHYISVHDESLQRLIDAGKMRRVKHEDIDDVEAVLINRHEFTKEQFMRLKESELAKMNAKLGYNGTQKDEPQSDTENGTQSTNNDTQDTDMTKSTEQLIGAREINEFHFNGVCPICNEKISKGKETIYHILLKHYHKRIRCRRQTLRYNPNVVCELCGVLIRKNNFGEHIERCKGKEITQETETPVPQTDDNVLAEYDALLEAIQNENQMCNVEVSDTSYADFNAEENPHNYYNIESSKRAQKRSRKPASELVRHIQCRHCNYASYNRTHVRKHIEVIHGVIVPPIPRYKWEENYEELHNLSEQHIRVNKELYEEWRRKTCKDPEDGQLVNQSDTQNVIQIVQSVEAGQKKYKHQFVEIVPNNVVVALKEEDVAKWAQQIATK